MKFVNQNFVVLFQYPFLPFLFIEDDNLLKLMKFELIYENFSK